MCQSLELFWWCDSWQLLGILSYYSDMMYLAVMKFATKIIATSIFGDIWWGLILIRCGKFVSREKRLDKLSTNVYFLNVRFQKLRLLWRNTDQPGAKWLHEKWTVQKKPAEVTAPFLQKEKNCIVLFLFEMKASDSCTRNIDTLMAYRIQKKICEKKRTNI